MATTRKKVAEEAPVKRRSPAAKEVASAAAAVSGRRVKLSDENAQVASSYFVNVDERNALKFVSTGCAVFDCALGGGWVLGRVVNIVGDKSAGKTLLAIEACANFAHRYPTGKIRYTESEAAFDERYAEALGMPVERVDFDPDNPITTIEEWYKDLLKVMDDNKDRPVLYILDSLDALSDDAEQGRDIEDGTYGGNKAKKLGEMFRRIVQRMEEQEVLLIVVSQLRDKINAAAFGEKQTRSGGRALDFYASHIVWLAEIGKITREMSGVKRVTGVNVRARVRKNKVGLPFRECNYPILLGYGVDDLTANVEWLVESKLEHRLADVGMSKAGYKVRIANLRDKGGEPVREVRAQLTKIVTEEWQRIETGFLPKSRKY